MKKLPVAIIIIFVIIDCVGFWFYKSSTAKVALPAKPFTASVTQGIAPLSVTFEGTTNDRFCQHMLLDVGRVYKIDFGDGKKSVQFKGCANFSELHTYQNAGTYISSFVAESYSLAMMTRSATTSTVIITVKKP